MSTWNYLRAYSDEANLEKAIREITEDNFGVELWIKWFAEPDALDESRWADIRKMAGGASLSLHTALSSCDAELFHKEVDMAAALGASVLVAHEGTLGLELEDKSAGLECCRRALDYATSKGVRVALENSPVMPFEKAVAEVCRETEICLDVGHANLTEGGIAGFLEMFGSRISHVHLSDNYGEKDDHLVPGEGYISMEDWRNIFQTLHGADFAGNIVFEIKTRDPRRDAKRAREFINYVTRSTEK